VGQVLLSRDVPSLGFELFERPTLSPDSVKIEEAFWTRVPVFEPGGRAKLVVPCDLFLKWVGQVALCHREDFPGWLVFGVSLQLNLRQPDFLLEVSDSSPLCLLFFLCDFDVGLEHPSWGRLQPGWPFHVLTGCGLSTCPCVKEGEPALLFFQEGYVKIGDGFYSPPPGIQLLRETKNLSILETTDPRSFLPLSKVNSFLDIFLKLSRVQASVSPYWRVSWCQAVDSLLCILLCLAVPLVPISLKWLKSPLIMVWSAVKLASLILLHKGALLLDVLEA